MLMGSTALLSASAQVIMTWNPRGQKEYDRKPELLPHFTAHCLRHTFCTRLCECEKDLAVIQHLMGHSDIETTLTVYDHVSLNRLRKAMNSLDQAYVFGLL